MAGVLITDSLLPFTSGSSHLAITSAHPSGNRFIDNKSVGHPHLLQRPHAQPILPQSRDASAQAVAPERVVMQGMSYFRAVRRMAPSYDSRTRRVLTTSAISPWISNWRAALSSVSLSAWSPPGP